jgi:hypothetical protein
VKRAIVAEPPLGRQPLFPVCVWLPQGFIGCRKFWQAFFENFSHGSCWESNVLEARTSGWMVYRNVLSMRSESNNPVTNHFRNMALKLEVAHAFSLVLRV